MSWIKSFSVGNGDMFYIRHNSDNFTIIDCCLDEDSADVILEEIVAVSKSKTIRRFISTHPDEDHVRGLELLDNRIRVINFYCVKNDATKEDESESFTKYRELRDSDKAFFLSKGCRRKWMNESDEVRKASGIEVLWPDLTNGDFQDELALCSEGDSPNNISPIISYTQKDGVVAIWMGDLETDFMEAIADHLDLPRTSILFAPHHGRDSGKVPEALLNQMDPRIIVVGEAPSEHLNYYAGYNTITQNSAGDIVFDCQGSKVHIFTSLDYSVDFLDDEGWALDGYHYIGTLNLE